MTRHSLITYLIVFAGAGLGGSLRHAVNRLASTIPGSVPWPTLIVNVSGCLAMGLLAGWFAFRGESAQGIRLFLATGLLGGYTTFSAFSLDVALLWERDAMWSAAGYVLASVVGAIAAMFVGLLAARAWTGP